MSGPFSRAFLCIVLVGCSSGSPPAPAATASGTADICFRAKGTCYGSKAEACRVLSPGFEIHCVCPTPIGGISECHTAW
jgi:hypothetical protein